MRNLKRALSLLLSSTMVLGMMVMGGNAVGYQDVDASNDNQEAIEVLQAVGVMSGVDNEGNFDPNGSVTRNQMAVIMAHLLNLDYDYYRGTNPFSDVPEWAAPYVAACAAEGVIAGIGNGQFGGEMKVTAAQASLMIMKALGYFQNQEDFGTDWQVATIRQASYINLFDRVDSDAESALTRGQVAQLVLNGLKAKKVNFTGDKGIQIGDVTVGYRAEYTPITNANTKYNSIDDGTTTIIGDNGQYFVQLGEELYNGNLKLQPATDDFGRPSRHWEYNGAEVGTYVKNELLVEEYTTKVTGKDLYELLGASTIKDYSTFIYVDGETEKSVLDSTGAYFTAGNLVKTNTEAVGATGNGVLTQVFMDTQSKEVTISIINTYLAKATDDYDEKKDEADFEVYKISDAGHSGKYVKTGNSTENFNKISSEDFSIVTDVKDGDFYLVTVAAGELQSIDKANVVAETTISKFVKKSSVTADGTEYKYASTAMYDTTVLDNYDDQNMKDTIYNIYLDPYGYLIGVDIVEEASKYLFLTGIDGKTSNLANMTADANVITLDGKIATVKVNMDKSVQEDGTTKLDPAAVMNTWCIYTVDKNGVYTLTEVAKTNGNFTSADKAGQGRNSDTSSSSAADVATIDKKHVSLNGITSSSYETVYGNDESIYLLAETEKLDAADKTVPGGSAGDAVIISGVDTVTTGIQNANLKAWNAQKVEQKGDGDNANDYGVTPLTDISDGVYTLFNKDGYVIAAVVVGEDEGATSNYAYVISDDLNMESYNSTDEEYTWTRDVVINGVVTELTEVGGSNPEIKGMLPNTWYEVKYYADGTVRSVSTPITFNAAAGKFVNGIQYVEDSFDAGYDTVALFEDLTAQPYALSVKANTLQVDTSVAGTSKGFAVAANAKIVLVQDEKVKSDGSIDTMAIIEEYDNGVSGLEKAIKDLNDNSNFKGYISAVFEGGLATSVVIYDKTETIIDDGDESGITPDAQVLLHTDGKIYVNANGDSILEQAQAIKTYLEKNGYTNVNVTVTGTDIAATGENGGVTFTWSTTTSTIDNSTGFVSFQVNGTTKTAPANTHIAAVTGVEDNANYFVKLSDGTYVAANTNVVAGKNYGTEAYVKVAKTITADKGTTTDSIATSNITTISATFTDAATLDDDGSTNFYLKVGQTYGITFKFDTLDSGTQTVGSKAMLAKVTGNSNLEAMGDQTLVASGATVNDGDTVPLTVKIVDNGTAFSAAITVTVTLADAT